MVLYLNYNTTSTGVDGNPLRVKTSDISTVGAYGGLIVNDLMSNSGATGISLTSDGKTLKGNAVMVTFNNGVVQDHAVKLKEVTSLNGNTIMKYYDPQNNSYGTINGTNYFGLYEVY